MTSLHSNGKNQVSPSRLLERLKTARHEQFIGREDEMSLFREILVAPELPFLLLYIFGPGGVGKTSLLREFDYLCAQSQIPATYVDMRDVHPSPESFVKALQAAMNLSAGDAPLDILAAQPHRQVLMIDTYENLVPLSNWLTHFFLPQLPENMLTVLAGRDPLPVLWQTDPGWRALVQTVALRNFSAEESRAFLAKRGVPPEHYHLILDFTHGHPLALSLIADEFTQRGSLSDDFSPETAPNIIKTLIDRFVREVPTPVHRLALESCAQVRLMTEPLLAKMLDISEAHHLFEWLRGLSFVESGPQGIFLHDLAGKALETDLRWRNDELYAQLLKRTRTYYTTRLQQAGIDEQQRLIMDYIYLHRHNPIVRPFLKEAGDVAVIVDQARSQDWSILTAMVAHHEGEVAANLAGRWFEHQPHHVLTLRSADLATDFEPLGFMLALALNEADPEALARDPATQAAWRYLQAHAPLRAGEKATIFRFWMTRDSYQMLSPVQGLLGVNMVRYCLTTPGLAFTFFTCADPEFLAPLCAYAGFARLTEADFEVGGHAYGVYGHDWRTLPPLKWLDMMADRETMLTPPVTTPFPAVTDQLVVLSKSEFAKAVHEALRHLFETEGLRNNPLLRSRLVIKTGDTNLPLAEQIVRLQQVIRTSIETLPSSPRRLKLYRALYHTYLQPAPTQEQAAELLDLPYSTFRRHLKAGVDEVTEYLWRQEISG